MSAMALMNSETAIRLLIADDNELTRMGLTYGLGKSRQVDIVAHACDGHEAVKLALDFQPDVILMDLGMPGMDGIAATRAIKAAAPEIQIVMLTADCDKASVMASLAAGADAYCIKDIRMDRLLQVLEMVCEGAVWLDPAIARLVTGGLPEDEEGMPPAGKRQRYNATLTDREREVLALIVDGRSNKEIALMLTVTTHTVKAHVCGIIRKLGVDDRTQAAVRALQDNLVNPPGNLKTPLKTG